MARSGRPTTGLAIPTKSRRQMMGFARAQPILRASEFNHRAARQRDVAGDADGAAFGELKCRVLLVIDALASA
jgi:hypothetical protein